MTQEELEKRLRALEGATYKRRYGGNYDRYLDEYIEGSTILDFMYLDSRQVYNTYLEKRHELEDDDGLAASVVLFNRKVREKYPELYTTHMSKNGVNMYIWISDKK